MVPISKNHLGFIIVFLLTLVVVLISWNISIVLRHNKEAEKRRSFIEEMLENLSKNRGQPS